MFEGTIYEKTKKDLAILTKTEILKKFYLGGGTGLAFQLKHRISFDLDFFSEEDVDTKYFINRLKGLGKLSVLKESGNSLTCMFNNTRISFLKYNYPCIFDLIEIFNIKVADSRDIGCMKIDAVSSRGTKRDFVDLFFVCKKVLPLDKLLELFRKKYSGVDYNLIHIFKSLAYFEDAQGEPMPKMMVPVSWEEIKIFFEKEIKIIKKRYL